MGQAPRTTYHPAEISDSTSRRRWEEMAIQAGKSRVLYPNLSVHVGRTHALSACAAAIHLLRIHHSFVLLWDWGNTDHTLPHCDHFPTGYQLDHLRPTTGCTASKKKTLLLCAEKSTHPFFQAFPVVHTHCDANAAHLRSSGRAPSSDFVGTWMDRGSGRTLAESNTSTAWAGTGRGDQRITYSAFHLPPPNWGIFCRSPFTVAEICPALFFNAAIVRGSSTSGGIVP